MRVALVYTDSDHYRGAGYDRAWADALGELGCEVAFVHDVVADGAGRFDAAVAHVLVEEVALFGPTLRAASALELAGVPMLNSVSCLVASADKLATHAVWAAHGLPQPRTWDLDRLDAWPAPGEPLVVKPSWGDGARGIALVESLEEARAARGGWRAEPERRGPAVLQEWIREPAVVRIFATPHTTSKAYEKDRHVGALVTHGTVYPHVYDPSPELAELAQQMVATLGGGLMGVDVLTDADGRHHALEANAPFGFDVTDPEQGRFVAGVVAGLAREGVA